MVQRGITSSLESVTHLLSLDHRRLDAILAGAKQSLRAGDVARGLARFSEFREGLERHIATEEEVLFPVFEALTGATGGGPTHVMRMEHSEICRLMATVVSELERGGDQGHITPLPARIYAHNGKEERIVYPALDQAARDANALEEVIRRIRAF